MNQEESIVNQDLDACNLSIWRNEEEYRAWIACLEENQEQARAALDAIVPEKSCAVESEQQPAAG